MRPGQVWLVVGRPGEACTTVVVQWAAAVAEQDGQHVHHVTPREEPRTVAARLASMGGLIPLNHLTRGIEGVPEHAVAAARERVAALSLSLYAAGEDFYVPEVHPERARARPTAIAISDADLVPGVTPPWAQQRAADGQLVVLGLPRHVVHVEGGGSKHLDPAWARVADVVVEVEHRGVSPLRPGEADLHVHYNRHGYTRTVSALHQAHYARIAQAST